MSIESDNSDTVYGVTENSKGQYGSDAVNLDQHYRLAKPEYDQCIREVGFQTGWRVLDAGCGNGVFVRQLSELVSSTGKVVAFDHDPESIEIVRSMLSSKLSLSNISVESGTIANLPFADNEFDAVWCANVTQYLTDLELDQAVLEFKRIVRPGGYVVIKEFDTSLMQIHPVDMLLFWRLGEALISSGHVNSVGVLRSPFMSRWLRKQGMEIIQRRTYLVERTAPMDLFTLNYAITTLQQLGGLAQDLDLADADKNAWKYISDNATEIMDDPDSSYREMFTVTVGRVRK